jgi:mycothiol synthase
MRVLFPQTPNTTERARRITAMTALDDLRLRPFRFEPDDTPELARLIAGVPELVASGEDFSEEALRAQERWPGYEPERDRWVAEALGEPGRLVGYASVFLFPNGTRADLMVAVHPDWRRRGLGRELLRSALADAHSRGATDANVYLGERDTEAISFARAQGFAPFSAYTRLTAPGDTSFPAPVFPPGYSVRACRGQEDYRLFIESANTCYADLWGHNPVSEENGREWFAGMDHSGVGFLFSPDGALVGRVSAERAERDGQPVGVIDAPGVLPAERGNGLHAPLLLWAIAWIGRQPGGSVSRYVIDSWGDVHRTLAAYQSLGFRVERREAAWRLSLAG